VNLDLIWRKICGGFVVLGESVVAIYSGKDSEEHGAGFGSVNGKGGGSGLITVRTLSFVVPAIVTTVSVTKSSTSLAALHALSYYC